MSIISFFISLLKHSKDLSVSDPNINIRLENVKDLLTTFQERTQKMMKLDRTKKTVKNIQQGLPFNIDAVTLCYENLLCLQGYLFTRFCVFENFLIYYIYIYIYIYI